MAAMPHGWHNWALGLLCLLVADLAITSVGSSSADSAAAQRTATVERGVVQSTVSGNGSLEAAQQVELDFGASSEVTEIDVQAGQKVSKGECWPGSTPARREPRSPPPKPSSPKPTKRSKWQRRRRSLGELRRRRVHGPSQL